MCLGGDTGLKDRLELFDEAVDMPTISREDDSMCLGIGERLTVPEQHILSHTPSSTSLAGVEAVIPPSETGGVADKGDVTGGLHLVDLSAGASCPSGELGWRVIGSVLRESGETGGNGVSCMLYK